MAVQNSTYSARPSPGLDPDLNGNMAGLQMAMATSSSSAPPKLKPTIPQKKTNVDELYRLRREVEDSRQAREERDAMADDLLKLQEEAEEKDEELRKLKTEIWTLREKADRLSMELLGQNRADARSSGDARLQAELSEARQQVDHLKAALTEANAKSEANTSRVADVEPGVGTSAELQEAKSRFQAHLAQVENYWRSQVAEHQKLRQAAENGLHGTRTYYETKLTEVETQARSQLFVSQRRIQDAENALQQHVQQQQQGHTEHMEIDPSAGNTEELERLRQVTTELGAKVEDQRRCAEQFRKMSERLTTEVKKARAAHRTLEQSEQVMRRQVEETRKPNAAPRSQQPNGHMPGAFQNAS